MIMLENALPIHLSATQNQTTEYIYYDKCIVYSTM